MVFHVCRIGLRRGAQVRFPAAQLGIFQGVGGVHASKMAPAVRLQFQQPCHRGMSTLKESLLALCLGPNYMNKFDEKSKIIVVDGNIGCGKSEFSKELADKMGMRYFPEAHIHYLDELELGEGKKYDSKYIGDVSLERFYKDPFAKDGHSFRFQMMMYAMRFRQYADVIEHLLTTGQGVVLERSVYSDYVFMDAMLQMGYFRNACRDFYNEVKDVSLYRLRPPHLVVYLDAPVDVLQKRIKERSRDGESEISGDYLKLIEEAYKGKFLPEMSETTEVLSYDWSKYGQVDQVVEDISILKFEHLPWNTEDNTTLHKLYQFVSNKFHVARSMDLPKYLPEITFGGHEFYNMSREFEETFKKSYAPGYNLKEGESRWKLLFK